MTEQEYSPENPAIGGVDTGKEFHPTREDLEKEEAQKRHLLLTNIQAPPTIRQRVVNAVGRMVGWNNSIHIPAWEWVVIFALWWMAMMFILLSTISGLGAMYELQHMTFNVGGIAFLLNVAGFMLFPFFPVYVAIYGIMSLSQSGNRG